MRLARGFLACLALAVGFPLRAEPPRKAFSLGRPAVHTSSLGEGLPSPRIHDLKLDSRGRLWAGTGDGAAVHNGRFWVPVRLPAIGATNWVRAIQETRDGAMWFGTDDGGLWCLRQGTWAHYGAETLGSARVNSLLEITDALGRASLWVGTAGGGIACFQEGRWTRLDRRTGLPSDWIWKIVLTRDDAGRGHLWICTQDAGLLHRPVGSRGPWEAVTERQGLPSKSVNDLLEVIGPDGTRILYAACWGAGLARRVANRWIIEGPDTGFPSIFPTSLATTPGSDGQPMVWVGTYDQGLAWHTEGRWHRLGGEQSPLSNTIYTLLANPNRKPTLWLGSRGGGVSSLDLGGWLTVDRGQGLPGDDAMAFLDAHDEAGRSAFLIGTTMGIASWDGVAWKRIPASYGAPHLHPTCMLETRDPEGEPLLWVGTLNGLEVRHRNRWRSYHVADGLPHERITCLMETREEDGSSRIWAGTENGLAYLEGRRWKPFPLAEGLNQPLVYILAIEETRDAKGTRSLWMASRGKGLARWRDGQWTVHNPANGFPSLSVDCLRESRSPDGRHWLWAGTLGGGLVRCDLDAATPAWEAFTTDTVPAIPSNVIFSLALDRAGRLYLGTQQGVARLNFQAGGHAVSRVEAFTTADGLPSLSCNASAATVDGEGRVWIGTYLGAACLDLRREQAPPPLPLPYIERVLVGGKARAFPPGTRLGHKDNHLGFEFGIVSYSRGEGLRFRTQLEGLESEPGPWTHDGTREFAALRRGRYSLLVWAEDHLGHVAGPATLPFEIRAAPWASGWAWALYILAGGLALYGVVRLRTRVLLHRTERLTGLVEKATAEIRDHEALLEALNEEKNHFLGIAAHDLKNPLAAIGLEAELLGTGALEPAEVAAHSASIRESAARMSELISKLLDINAIESQRLDLAFTAVDLHRAAAEASREFAPRARAKAILIEVEGEPGGPTVRVDPVHLREVLDNLLSNAIKFMPAGPPERRIRIRARCVGNAGAIEVEDQGPGFTDADKAQLFTPFSRLSAQPTAGEGSTGLGLSIAKRLVESMGGRISLESEAGRGATFLLEFPLADV